MIKKALLKAHVATAVARDHFRSLASGAWPTVYPDPEYWTAQANYMEDALYDIEIARRKVEEEERN